MMFRLSLRRILAFSAQLSALSVVLGATELTDLGQGLGYLRVNDYAAVEKAVASNLPENRALVLDLRHALADDAAAGRFATALAARNVPTPLFVLVGPGTPPALAAALARPPAGVLTVGIKDSIPAPQVTVVQTADADRRAYDALETGVPLAALVNGRLDKERYDESSLVQDFTNGNRSPAPPTPPDPTATGSKPAEKPPPLTDRVLQRAIHLHRALLAIKPR